MSDKSVKKQRLCTYHGAHHDGRFRIKVRGKNALVCGVAYQVISSVKRTADGKKLWVEKLFGTTPGYKALALHDQRFIAHCPTSGTRFRVIGQLKYLDAKRAVVPVNVHPVETNQAANGIAIALSPHAVDAIPRGRTQRTKRAFALELEAIAAQRAAGLDPDVRLWFITAYLGESRANLYRKLGTTFPKPIKRGRSSFWPMSVIEEYKVGTYCGEQQ